MAFMGLMFIGILLLIFGLIVICGIVFLVIGLIIRINRVMLIDYGMYNLNIEIMQCAFHHGATFDNPLSYDHLIFYNSLDSFFDRIDYPKQDKGTLHQPGITNDEIINTVKFAIEHGAKLNYHNNKANGYQNFYEEAAEWVKRDDFVTVQETEWLNYLFQKLQEETEK